MALAELLHSLAGLVVLGFGLFLLGLATVLWLSPRRAQSFLGGFASSAAAHDTEVGVRFVVGVALVVFAGAMRFPEVFRGFGWLLLVSTAGLLAIPWQWHQRFAARVMPPVYRHLRLLALGACALGAFVFYCFPFAGFF